MFKPSTLYYTDGYKVGHKAMLAPGTTKLYGTWIPRSLKHAPKGVEKIVSFGHQLTWKWLHDEFEENFFFTNDPNRGYRKQHAMKFISDMTAYLGLEYDGQHFSDLWDLGYLPIKVKALPEGIETGPNIPHMTFVNTVDGYAWLTLYLETIVSSLAWKSSTAATIARLYRKQAEEWVKKTDPEKMWLVDFMCHDFSSRGLSPFDIIAVGLGHATSFKGSDTLITIPASRYFYNEADDFMPVFSVNASEHSVSTTKIFTVGEQQMLSDWMKIFPKGILSVVSDTFDLWKLITEYLPVLKEEIMSRDGKLVIRPDSGDPVDIICGLKQTLVSGNHGAMVVEVKGKTILASQTSEHELKGVIELLWDIFGGTVNEQGYKVLDPHIGAIYGDSITPDRQKQIYERLAAKGFAATNIVLGVGSFTYQYNTRDTLGFAAKGAWFEVLNQHDKPCNEDCEKAGKCLGAEKKSYNIYKDPVTDDGTKKSLKGLLQVDQHASGKIMVFEECTPEMEERGLLQVIYEDGKFYNQTTLSEIRQKLVM